MNEKDRAEFQEFISLVRAWLDETDDNGKSGWDDDGDAASLLFCADEIFRDGRSLHSRQRLCAQAAYETVCLWLKFRRQEAEEAGGAQDDDGR